MARPKKHVFPLTFAEWLMNTAHLSLAGRAVLLELVWFQSRFGPDSLPMTAPELARIARCSQVELRRLSNELATLFPERFAQANPPSIHGLTLPVEKPVENLSMDRGNHRPVIKTGTLPGTESGTSTYVRTSDTDRVKGSPDGSPSLRSVPAEESSIPKTREDAPGTTIPIFSALPLPPATDHPAVATWLVRAACLARGGTVRGDHLRRAVFELSQAPEFGAGHQGAIPMAWSALFWKSLPQIRMRVAPDQPPNHDPGHPEMEVTWTERPL